MTLRSSALRVANSLRDSDLSPFFCFDIQVAFAVHVAGIGETAAGWISEVPSAIASRELANP
jgi:hypothetical protein